MSSALSSGAIHLIVGFVEGNVTSRRKSNRSSTVRSRKDSLSMERRLLLKNAVGYPDMQDVFAHGKPLVYDGEDYPRLFVPKIVEAFRHLKEEPAFLDITIAVPRKNVGPWCTNKVPISMDHPTEVWPQAYHSYLPCATCTTVEASKVWRIKNKQPPAPPSSLLRYVVEKIHVSSKHFGKQLTVELHFNLGDQGKVGDGDVPVRPPTASNTEKIGLHKVVIRMSDGVCSASVVTSMARTSKSVLLLPDFASEVYGFIDRVHAGTSLIANRGLNELMFKLRHLLPMHHLMCEFEEATVRRGPTSYAQLTGDYWMIVHHFRRDLTYSDVRRFKIAYKARPAAYCSLIRCCLSNSHVADFKAPPGEPRFTLKMLAALVDRNFSIGRLRMRALYGQLTDYRSMDAVFRGGMRLGALNLWIREECLEHLIKTTDFLRLPTVQGLTELKLQVVGINKALTSTRRQRAVLSSSLWINGIHQLRNCALYRVNYDSTSRFEPIALNLVQICEKFERGEVSETVEHFVLSVARHVAFPFKDDNKTASGIRVKTANPFASVSRYTWDVYRFRNVTTGEWLTAFVGHAHDAFSTNSILHLLKGEAHPNASYPLE